jgi:transposase InsO family protein
MGLADYLVRAVVEEGGSVGDVAAAHGVSKSWLYELLARYRRDGDAGLLPHSKRPRSSPTQVPAELEERIVALRKTLLEAGLEAGPQTLHFHLGADVAHPPSVSSIWRILSRRGFVTPQPHKRPRSAWVRFEAQLPNECWQGDATHWALSDDTGVEILNLIDDHSRLLIASTVFRTIKVTDVVATFYTAAARHGFPASLLTDNGAIFTNAPRRGRSALETELDRLGITHKHSRPYHPQTCGKIERFHQTLKRWLTRQPAAETLAELNRDLERFVDIYNTQRPHRAVGRRTPTDAFSARIKAAPTNPNLTIPRHDRVRHDKIDSTGCITLRHKSRLHHIGVGRAHKHTRVLVLVADLDVRILAPDGELLRALTSTPPATTSPATHSPG